MNQPSIKQKHFKTKAGTELPLLDLRGKDYLQVAHRLVWFREEHPSWTISTFYLQLSENHAIAKAIILDDRDRPIASGHKCEDRKGFSDFVEKAETGAIGRALAACGYGTQFAPELDEAERIVDSPTLRAKKLTNAPLAVSQSVTATIQEGDEPPQWHMTDAQRGKLWAVARDMGWSNEEVKSYIAKLGLQSTLHLNYTQYENLLKAMRQFPRDLIEKALEK